MIQAHQPLHLPVNVVVAFSSKDDGSLLNRLRSRHENDIVALRKKFCQENGIDYQDTVYQVISYDNQQTYDTIARVGASETVRFVQDVSADALITTEPGVGLFLPVADCAATVVYDPKRYILAVLHLGRHSTLSNLIPKTLAQFEKLESDIDDLLVWMSPHAGRESYRLEWFDEADQPEWKPFVDAKPDGVYVDLAAYNKLRFIRTGVPEKNIEVSDVDTMRDMGYFSHANGEHGGRMALLAYMR